MSYQTILVRKLYRFVPGEAHTIAAELQAVAANGSELAGRLKVIIGNLESSWEGQAKVRFLAESNGMPAQGESVSDWLRAEAGRVRSITVERWETVSEETWVPD